MAQDHRQDWDQYWRRAGAVPVFGQFTKDSRTLPAFWTEFLSKALADRSRTNMLDMACGSGAVTSVALTVAQRLGRGDLAQFCLDYSAAAVLELRARLPHIKPTAANASAAPYADAAFHVVASQFGLEYAGAAAFAEAARLVAANGVFCAVCHLDAGVIHKECLDNLDTLETIVDCRLMPLAKAAFSALFAMDRGVGTASAARTAHEALSGSIATLSKLIEDKGVKAADGTPARIYRDLTYMYNRRRNFDPTEVLDWVDKTAREITAYAGRMKSMAGAALDGAAMSGIRQSLISHGMAADEPTMLHMGSDRAPAAWILKAAR